MSRTVRLLRLVQLLRRLKQPATARWLALELATSTRTVYRDIETLSSQGFRISGEAGVGYVLRPGSLLPPMAFSRTELDAMVLGLRWVLQHGDAGLGDASLDALGKIAAVLSPESQRHLKDVALIAGPTALLSTPHLANIRGALNAECRLQISYKDKSDFKTCRVVWPIAMVFFDAVYLLVAWCELREDFRTFRIERIERLSLGEHYPIGRSVLLERWKERRGITDDR